uniref:SFRICE_014988 n=1 Tax=Spodoptera frugiperda TaxID=7108 RepID=A0A2H1V8C2_SPOFR
MNEFAGRTDLIGNYLGNKMKATVYGDITGNPGKTCQPLQGLQRRDVLNFSLQNDVAAIIAAAGKRADGSPEDKQLAPSMEIRNTRGVRIKFLYDLLFPKSCPRSRSGGPRVRATLLNKLRRPLLVRVTEGFFMSCVRRRGD